MASNFDSVDTHSLPLSPPPPADQIVEHDLVAPASRHDLPVMPAQGRCGPPSVLDQPRLAHRVDLSALDRARLTVLGGADRDAAGDREPARTGHQRPPLANFRVLVPTGGT